MNFRLLKTMNLSQFNASDDILSTTLITVNDTYKTSIALKIDDARAYLFKTTFSTVSVLMLLVLIAAILCVALWLQSKDHNLDGVKSVLQNIFFAAFGTTFFCLIGDILYISLHGKSIDDKSVYRRYFAYRMFNLFGTGCRVVYSLSILVISLHRFYAVVRPLKYKQMWMVVHAKKIVAIIWLISLPVFFFIVCYSLVEYADTSKEMILYAGYFVYCVNIPLCTAVVTLHILIVIKIRKRNILMSTCMNLKGGANYRTVILCTGISISFVITYLPISLSVIVFRNYHFHKEFIHLYLIGLVVDPLMYIFKRVFEKRCCRIDTKNPTWLDESKS